MHLKIDKTLPTWKRRLLLYKQLDDTMPFPTVPVKFSRLATNYRSAEIWSAPLRAFDLISVACLCHQALRQEWLINGEPVTDQENTDQSYYRKLYNAVRVGLSLDNRNFDIDSDPTLQELIERRVSTIDLISTTTEGFAADRQLQEIGKEDLAWRIESLRAIQKEACGLLLKLIMNLDHLICEHLGWPINKELSVKALRNEFGFDPHNDDESQEAC